MVNPSPRSKKTDQIMLKSVQDLKKMQIGLTTGFYLEIQQHFKVSN